MVDRSDPIKAERAVIADRNVDGSTLQATIPHGVCIREIKMRSVLRLTWSVRAAKKLVSGLMLFAGSVGLASYAVADEAADVSFAAIATEESLAYEADAEQVAFLSGASCNRCQKSSKLSPCAKSHKGVFYNNDFSYLNSCNQNECLGDCLKLMPVDNCGRWGTLDVGGQLRLRYHNEHGMAQQVDTSRFQDTDNELLLTRLRLYTNWKLNDNVRFYFEGILADVTANDEYDPRRIDRNWGDLTNAFVDLRLTDSSAIRIGRQELLFGAQRTVSPLDWANTRRTFEGVRYLYREDKLSLDAFFTNFVPVDHDAFDEANYDQKFYGVYGNYKASDSRAFDFYYLGYDNDKALNGSGVGSADFSLHTIGLRMYGKVGDWMYEFEGAPQFGRQSGAGIDHSAGFATIGLGRQFKQVKWKPTVWFYYDYASGQDAGGDYNRYNQLFPLAHKYLGFIDATQRANIESPNVLVKLAPSKKVDLLFWYYHLMANSATDIVPSLGSTPTQSMTSKDWGNELDFIAKYKINPRSNLLVGYSHFWAGNKILAPEDADFTYVQWELNF